jgi:hypothetical protein
MEEIGKKNYHAESDSISPFLRQDSGRVSSYNIQEAGQLLCGKVKRYVRF